MIYVSIAVGAIFFILLYSVVIYSSKRLNNGRNVWIRVRTIFVLEFDVSETSASKQLLHEDHIKLSKHIYIYTQICCMYAYQEAEVDGKYRT